MSSPEQVDKKGREGGNGNGNGGGNWKDAPAFRRNKSSKAGEYDQEAVALPGGDGALIGVGVLTVLLLMLEVKHMVSK